MKTNARFEHVYSMMLGVMVEQAPEIKNEFVPDSECDKLYSAAYAARERITRALGASSGNSDGADNADVLIIVTAYESMQKILCKQCYLQGYNDAKNNHAGNENGYGNKGI